MAADSISSLFIYNAYDGCLAGWRSPEQCVKGATEKATLLFGAHVPIFVVPPEEDSTNEATKSGRQPPLIPGWAHVARLEGKAQDQGYDGSWLVLIWFAKTPSFPELASLPEHDFHAHAKDWGF
jgi:hypothetical protein